MDLTRIEMTHTSPICQSHNALAAAWSGASQMQMVIGGIYRKVTLKTKYYTVETSHDEKTGNLELG